MYGRRSQRKRGLRRAVVTLLALVLLVSVCFPGLRASANGEKEPTYQITVNGEQTSTITGAEGSDHTWTSGDEYDSIVTIETADNVATLTAVNAGSVTITHTYTVADADGTTSDASEEYVVAVTEITEEETESSEIMLASADDEEEETADPTETTAKTEAEEEITLETVQAMIDALPDADDITEENMAEVEAQLDAIDDAKLNLTAEELDSGLDYTKYNAAIVALEALYGQEGASDAMLLGKNNNKENPDQTTTELDASSYKSSAIVYWDTYEGTSGTGQSTITSVTLAGSSVTWANSNSTVWSGGDTLSTYFPNTNNKQASATDTVTLSITPTAGYYVTSVVVACCVKPGGGTSTPYYCGTWEADNAFTTSFSTTTSTTVTTTVSSLDFSHSSNSDYYFILIKTAPVPSPLYVEYDYGNVEDFLTSVDGTVFADPDKWTDTDSSNNYVNSGSNGGGVITDDTQYKYVYKDNSSSEAASWTHYSNSVTDVAKALAAENGYYFAGWEVTYYNTCDNFYFGDVNATGSSYYQEGVNIPLLTHVRLVAVWVQAEPTAGKLTITKIFTDNAVTPTSVIFNVYDSDNNNVGNLTLNSDNNWTSRIESLTAGTYTITESGYEVDGYDCSANVDTGTLSGYTATVTLTAGEVTQTENSDGSYGYSVATQDLSVTFTNTYTPSTTSITLDKVVTGNMGDYSKEFTFTISVDDVDLDDQLKLSHTTSAVTIDNIPIGAKVTITESDNEGYKVSAAVNDESVSVTDNAISFEVTGNEAVVFTNNKEATIDTGVTLDSAPYIFLTVLALGGTVLLMKRRRVI